ncbi:MAG: hypothetical protein AB8I08_38440 [Sandaracinaceae bacterium]
MTTKMLKWVLCAGAVAMLGACDDGNGTMDAGPGGEDAGTGTDGGPAQLGDLNVVLEAEDTITEGLVPGSTGETIQDGWAVTFQDYITVIGDIDVHLATDETVEAEAGDTFAVDMVAVPESGLTLWTLDGLATGRWQFNYAIAGAGDGAMRHESVTEAQFSEMQTNDWTYLIAGTLTQTGGQSCPPAALAVPGSATANGNTNSGGDACYHQDTISFRFGIQAETAFGPCEIDEMPGFAVTAGSSTTVAATLHGDHIFFNGFPEGDEGGVMRLAQWLADCDLNLDGEVTREELEMIAPSDLPEIDTRYQLGGSPITPLNEMWDYVTAQVKTQGHFQGEGECPFDGMAHDHD